MFNKELYQKALKDVISFLKNHPNPSVKWRNLKEALGENSPFKNREFYLLSALSSLKEEGAIRFRERYIDWEGHTLEKTIEGRFFCEECNEYIESDFVIMDLVIVRTSHFQKIGDLNGFRKLS
ncbi:MAG TPA: hypothetical protein DEP48_03035 [Persephonella sp.]|uniref:Uncharacterized protein n=1 Tax=Persephonella marina (strain DSM 14350 / EX-H1) TaxID=123214 RepID=C0QSC1_PERMH|nr:MULTISPECIES: hypothetical protein [Persephonella]ACO04939.1 hypothetical protein PERMA_1804 [Persephonella marina EX-H1]HCB69313.1 hypothetical protein [Persephonella sp.]